MRIQHNIMAMNAYRNYNTNTSALSKNLEKLSSGYKINRAGDDAAGLAISEKMRAQITGLTAASKNVKDGISLVKTAEGAMQEIHDMLNRMDYLATQSANGTYDNDVDRNNLQKEVDSLRNEINRIADSANFNGIKLLNGDLGEVKATGTDWAMAPTSAAPVAGQNTILGEAKVSAVKTKFSIDLDGISATLGSTSRAIKLKIGNTSLASTTLAKNASYTASAIATAIKNKYNGTTATINTLKYTVTNTGSKLVFELQSLPTAATSSGVLIGNYDVGVSINGAGAGDAVSGTVNTGTQVITEGRKPSDGKMASTVVNLENTDVAHGAGVQIGNKTYVFKADKNQALNLGANQVEVDITDLDPATDMAQIVDRLTVAAANNEMFTVGQAGTDTAITLQQKTTYADADDKLKSLEGFQSQLQKFSADALAGTISGGLKLQIGDTSDGFNQLSVFVGDMHTKSMGTEGGLSIADISIKDQTNAAAAVDVIKNAINYVSGVRGDLGAIQNRLEHTQNNLSVMTENIQDAESTIRDTDVADEMMKYTKNNILIQSAQAMLAQANQVPQGVLQLLQ